MDIQKILIEITLFFPKVWFIAFSKRNNMNWKERFIKFCSQSLLLLTCGLLFFLGTLSINYFYPQGLNGKQNKRATTNASQAYTPTSEQAKELYNKGNTYVRKGEYDHAITYYTQAITLNPKHVNSYYNRAFAYGFKEQYNNAITDYTQAITLNPKYTSAYNNRARLYLLINRCLEARQDYSKAQSLGNPANPELLEMLNEECPQQRKDTTTHQPILIKTGVVIKRGVDFILDDVVKKSIDEDTGITMSIKLDGGTVLEAVCGKQLFSRVPLGQRVAVTPIKGSKFWKVAHVLGSPIKKKQLAAMQIEQFSYSDCFPLKIGTEWRYRIDIKDEVAPILYREEFWPFGSSQKDWDTLVKESLITKTSKKEHFLQFKIKSVVAKNNFPSAAKVLVDCDKQETLEIEVLKDDLSIFNDAKQVFWVKCPLSVEGKQLSIINQVMIYDAQDYPLSKKLKPVSDGFSRLPLFFTAGIGLNIPDTPSRSLSFEGGIPDSKGGHLPNLHFKRKIHTGKNGSKEIIEDMIFAKGRGMIELRQHVDGKLSMSWTLVEQMIPIASGTFTIEK